MTVLASGDNSGVDKVYLEVYLEEVPVVLKQHGTISQKHFFGRRRYLCTSCQQVNVLMWSFYSREGSDDHALFSILPTTERFAQILRLPNVESQTHFLN